METLYGKLVLPESKQIVGTGWLPQIPDLRDYTEYQKEIKAMSKMLGLKEGKMTLPSTVDLRGWCSPVKNQGSIGPCTANAGDYPKSRTKPQELQTSGLEYLE